MHLRVIMQQEEEDASFRGVLLSLGIVLSLFSRKAHGDSLALQGRADSFDVASVRFARGARTTTTSATREIHEGEKAVRTLPEAAKKQEESATSARHQVVPAMFPNQGRRRPRVSKSPPSERKSRWLAKRSPASPLPPSCPWNVTSA